MLSLKSKWLHVINGEIMKSNKHSPVNQNYSCEEETMLSDNLSINDCGLKENRWMHKKKIQRICSCLKNHWLLIFTVIGVVFGVLFGLAMRKLDPSVQTQMLITFPGELFMRALKMLILPLITSSLISGLAELDAKSSGKMGLYALTYYLSTTILAAMLGIILVVLIKPGEFAQIHTEPFEFHQHAIPIERTVSSMDSILDIFRNMFPENLVQACIQQQQTVREFTNKTKNGIEDSTEQRLTAFKLRTQNQTNFIGLITFCIAFGLCIGRMGANAKVMLDFFKILNEIIMKLVRIVMWVSPIGILSLIMGKVMEISDIQSLIKMLGMYALCVLTGLTIHALITLPLIYFIITRKNPFLLYRGVLQAWVTAIGTASSAATLPVTFDCLDSMGMDMLVTRFVLPIGATVNMDGTALYEAVAPVFIAQMNKIHLSIGQLVIVSLTATVASIGAASIPSAGLVTMLLVMSAVGLPAEEIMVILSIDWLLDRIRTSINVLGDCIGCGIVEHLTVLKIKRKGKTVHDSVHARNLSMRNMENNIITDRAAVSAENCNI
ncbi:hypothetical protein GJ496_004752 [Pomphorhynchus laevis]|nr:hypothetical protein GJ496_004752 [Pomphorhynchus laevis]